MNESDTQATGSVVPSATGESVAEDTATTQTSEASELSQVTPEATQSSEQTKEPAQTEVKAEDTVQEEKLYAGKYKSVEDLEKSYKELESAHGKKSSEFAELNKILTEAFASPEVAQTTDTTYEDNEESPAMKIAAQAQRKTTLLEFAISHPDADGDAMKDILANDPMIGKITGDDARLEYAYLRAQSMGQGKALAEAQKTAQAQTQAKIAEKQVAQVESVKKAEPADNKAELMSQATGGSPAERKAAREALIRKHLTNL